MTETTRYILVNDESGHQYVIPAEKADDWEEWLYSDGWGMGEVPNYASITDNHFTFTDPQSS